MTWPSSGGCVELNVAITSRVYVKPFGQLSTPVARSSFINSRRRKAAVCKGFGPSITTSSVFVGALASVTVAGDFSSRPSLHTTADSYGSPRRGDRSFSEVLTEPVVPRALAWSSRTRNTRGAGARGVIRVAVTLPRCYTACTIGWTEPSAGTLKPVPASGACRYRLRAVALSCSRWQPVRTSRRALNAFTLPALTDLVVRDLAGRQTRNGAVALKDCRATRLCASASATTPATVRANTELADSTRRTVRVLTTSRRARTVSTASPPDP